MNLRCWIPCAYFVIHNKKNWGGEWRRHSLYVYVYARFVRSREDVNYSLVWLAEFEKVHNAWWYLLCLLFIPFLLAFLPDVWVEKLLWSVAVIRSSFFGPVLVAAYFKANTAYFLRLGYWLTMWFTKTQRRGRKGKNGRNRLEIASGFKLS